MVSMCTSATGCVREATVRVATVATRSAIYRGPYLSKKASTYYLKLELLDRDWVNEHRGRALLANR